jgi:hypothetical protein
MSHDLYPFPHSEAVRGIALGIVLTLLTCGIYGLYWQYKQMATLNAWLGRDDFSFAMWFFLGILTCGIFQIYYEYKMAKGINEIQELEGMRVNSELALISLLLALFGLGIVSLAIQQSDINLFYDETGD